ncbi:MAG: 50S ribosomal protein L4 [Sphingobacteriales bacterium]|nr:50S ribosomal protein L4 [Sphingobacteriales bacterium]
MTIDILNTQGTSTGRTVELPDAIFGIEPNDHCIYLAVKQYLANQRQGTHKSKERSEVSGSTRKLHRQKGTGGSRKGDINNPLYPGGGRVFGPKPRDYRFKLNKKVKELARRSALAYKARENNIIVVEDLNLNQAKTKDFYTIAKNLGVVGKKFLLVTKDINPNVYLSARNIQNAQIMTAGALNTYQVMKAHSLILSEGAISLIQ